MQIEANSLKINHILPENAGRYHCIASNSFGRITKSVEIIVHFDEKTTIKDTDNQISCRNGTCLNTKAVCDGVSNCAKNENEDELNRRK